MHMACQLRGGRHFVCDRPTNPRAQHKPTSVSALGVGRLPCTLVLRGQQLMARLAVCEAPASASSEPAAAAAAAAAAASAGRQLDPLVGAVLATLPVAEPALPAAKGYGRQERTNTLSSFAEVPAASAVSY